MYHVSVGLHLCPGLKNIVSKTPLNGGHAFELEIGPKLEDGFEDETLVRYVDATWYICHDPTSTG